MKVRVTKLTDFNEQLRLLTGKSWRRVVDKEVLKAVRLSGEVLRANVVKGLKQGRPEWGRLHPYTVAIREFRGHHGTAPLVETGTLSRNVEVVVDEAALEVFVGVVRNVYSANGQSLKNIARMQERGYSIRVTPRMRAFFQHLGLRLKITTTHLTVRPRPFLQPAVEESRETVKQIFASAVAQILAQIQVKVNQANKLKGA